MGMFNPKEYDESTGLWPNDDIAKIVGAACVSYDYNGKQPKAVPCLKLDLMGEGLDKPVIQYFGVGKAEDWAPSPDGKSFIAIGKRRMLHASTNAAYLFKSMHSAGVPEDLLDKASGDVTALVGFSGRFVRTAIKREGLKDAEGKDKAFEVLVVTEVINLPGEEAAEGPPATDTQALTDKTLAAVLKFLAAAKSGKVKKADLPSLIFADPALLADPQRNELINLLVADDKFLTGGAAQKLWAFEGGVISKAA
jgi:hypothetical protein